MKKFIFKNRILINYITPLLLILVIPFVASICFLQYTVDFAVSQSEERSYSEINHVQEMVEVYLTTVRTKSLNIARNTGVLQLDSYNSQNVKDVYKISQLARELRDIAGSYEFSYGCYVYDKSSDIIFFNGSRYSTREFFDTYVATGQYDNWKNKLGRQYAFLCREGTGRLNNLSENGVIEYTQSYPLGGESEGTIVFLLDKSIFMNKNISNTDSNLQLYIFNKNNELIHGTENTDNAMIERLLGIAEGYSHVGGIGKALVSTATSENGSLRYVCIDKGSAAFRIIQSISMLIMIYAIIILLVGGVFVFYAARQMSRRLVRINKAIGNHKSANDWQELMSGIEGLSKNRNTMSSMLSTKNDIEKNMAFINFLYDYSGHGDYYRDVLEKHGVVFGDGQYVPVLGILELDMNEQAELIKFAIKNIFTDLNRDTFKWYFMDYSWNRVVFLINGNFDDQSMSNLDDMFRMVSDCILSIFEVIVEFNLGDVCDNLDSVRTSCRKLNERYRYKTIYGIMDDEDGSVDTYKYLYKQENELISLVLSGEAEEVDRYIDDMILAHKNAPYVIMNMLFYSLLGTFFKCCDRIGEKDITDVAEVENILYSSGPDEVGEKLRQLYAQLCSKITKSDGSGRYTTLSIKLVNYVDANYTNPNLSLKMLSSEFGITVSYISKIFKEQFGTNFSDYIANKRIEKAKELLSTTNLSISEIALKLGYVDSSIFIKNFKKNTGITPGAYRNS